MDVEVFKCELPFYGGRSPVQQIVIAPGREKKGLENGKE